MYKATNVNIKPIEKSSINEFKISKGTNLIRNFFSLGVKKLYKNLTNFNFYSLAIIKL